MDIQENDVCIVLDDATDTLGGIILFHDCDYGGGIMGHMARNQKNLWNSKLSLHVLSCIKDMIDSYNYSLCTDKEDIDKEIFTIKFLEGDSGRAEVAFVPERNEETEEILKKYKYKGKRFAGKYKLDMPKHSKSMIFIDEGTLLRAWNSVKYKALINLKKRIIMTIGLESIVDKHDYEELKGFAPSKDLGPYGVCLSELSFNEIDDLLVDLKKSPHGMKIDTNSPENISIAR